MEVWFTTSHGNTFHNQPNTPNYVEGEPPEYPLDAINYRLKCLSDGFARIGYPNTGDLNDLGRGRLAPDGYSFENVEMISNNPQTKNQLIAFAGIHAGDLITIPADEEQFRVHIGRVLTPNREAIPPYISPRTKAYFYYHDLGKGDYYECAHRVNVNWAKIDGEFGVFEVRDIGGVWRKAFGKLTKAADKVKGYARKAGI